MKESAKNTDIADLLWRIWYSLAYSKVLFMELCLKFSRMY